MWLWMLILALLSADAVPPAQCHPESPIPGQIRGATAIFSATVVGRERIPEPYVAEPGFTGLPFDPWVEKQFAPGQERVVERVWVNLEVHRVWKGRVPARVRWRTSEIRFSTGAGMGPIDHDTDFQDGRSYLIYAVGPADSLRSGICERTRPLDRAAEDLRVLGRGRPPRRS